MSKYNFAVHDGHRLIKSAFADQFIQLFQDTALLDWESNLRENLGKTLDTKALVNGFSIVYTEVI